MNVETQGKKRKNDSKPSKTLNKQDRKDCSPYPCRSDRKDYSNWTKKILKGKMKEN